MRTSTVNIETNKSLLEIYTLIARERDPIAGFARYRTGMYNDAGFEFRRKRTGANLNTFYLSKTNGRSDSITIRVTHHNFKAAHKWNAFVFFTFAFAASIYIGHILAFFFGSIPGIMMLFLMRREPQANDKWVEKELNFIASIIGGKMDNVVVQGEP